MKTIYAEASGNTFIIFDRLSEDSALDPSVLHDVKDLILKENRDDGLILTKESAKDRHLYLTMHVYGQDGTFGKFCGNGSRAAAAYLFANYPEYTAFSLHTPWGLCSLDKLAGGNYKTELPINSQTSPYHLEGKSLIYGEALEPHLTLNAPLSDTDLFDLGRKINTHTDLFPEGINVNAWHEITPGKIFVKTYERGVKRLTKSCGTGSCVSAYIYLKKDGPVTVQTPGGTLQITIQRPLVTLIGPATI